MKPDAKAQLRRDGMAWCPGCAMTVTESQMKTFDGDAWVTMRHCKACHSSGRIANDRAKASAHHRRTTSA